MENVQLDQFMSSYYAKAKGVEEREATLRAKLQDLLGTFDFPTSNHPQLLERHECNGYTRERYLFSSLEGLTIPVYVLTPKVDEVTVPFPTVVAIHGHGYGSKEIVGLREDGSEDTGEPGIHQHFAVQLVKRGLKVFAPEVIGFGERMHTRDIERGSAHSCYALSTLLLASGKTLAGLRVAETRHVVDQMKEFQDVNHEQIGMMGFSGGGLVSAYASALDERFKATVLCGFTNTFKGSILHTNHCIDNYIPSILKYGELPDYISLIAPRPLFVESGTHDPIFPVETTREAIKHIQKTYETKGAPSAMTYDIFPGKHEISGRYAYDWLKQSLEDIKTG